MFKSSPSVRWMNESPSFMPQGSAGLCVLLLLLLLQIIQRCGGHMTAECHSNSLAGQTLVILPACWYPRRPFACRPNVEPCSLMTRADTRCCHRASGGSSPVWPRSCTLSRSMPSSVGRLSRALCCRWSCLTVQQRAFRASLATSYAGPPSLHLA